MLGEPIRLAPQPCPKCGEWSFYVIPLPPTGQTVDLAWFCRQCHHEWPVVYQDARETPETPS